MRPFKKSKPKNPTILQEQSNKLKQKLQLLKRQVTLKKQEKQMSKTATSLKGNQNQQIKYLATTTKYNTKHSSVDTKLSNALIQMKIWNIQQKLKEKGVKSFEKLLSLSEEEIDQWKDMLVGYRIKIKKYVKTHANSQKCKESQLFECDQPLFSKKEQKGAKIQYIESKYIQDIIKERQKVKVFVAIEGRIQQEQFDDSRDYQITDEDQDIMIKSLMDVFQPRRRIMKKQNENAKQPRKRKMVRWSKQVQTMQKQFKQKNHKKYPKQAVPKQVLTHLQHANTLSQSNTTQNDRALKYCWKCFRKIDIKHNIGFRITGNKYFCSQKCQTLYENEISHFQNRIDNIHIYQSEQQITNEHQQQGIETIDLSIL